MIHEEFLAASVKKNSCCSGEDVSGPTTKLRHGNYNAQSKAEDWFNFQASGPLAIHVVEKVANQGLRDVKFMHSGKINICGHEVLALRQGMAGEIGFELQGPAEYAKEIHDAVMDAGKEFGIRRLGGRAVFINHLEACFPTIITDYCPAIFDDNMAEYRAEFQAAMPAVASTFNIAGSFEADNVTAWYRSPVELGWGKNIKFDHDFIGRAPLEAEVANPKRVMRTLVWNADDVVNVYASLFSQNTPLRHHGASTRSARFYVR